MQCHSDADRQAILDFARHAILEAVIHGRILSPFPGAAPFDELCALFVTVHSGNKLRGCIGILDAQRPLGENLARCAADAVRHDPRFSSVRGEEIALLHIEVSLLSPLEPIRPEQVEIGKHGLLIEHGNRRGLLLPQVAVHHHFDREQFLSETCGKAGLPRDAWKSPETRLFAFECEVISDAEVEREENKSPLQ